MSSKYCISCTYYFTKQLTGIQLREKNLEVLKNIEKCRFGEIRIKTDNAKINLSMFKLFGNGMLLPSIPFSCDSNRKIFLSFHPNYIIKSVRSLFLENDITGGKE